MTIATKMPETLDDVVDSELEEVETEETGDAVDDSLGDDLEPEAGDPIDADFEVTPDEPANTGDPIQPPVNPINAEEHFRQRVEAAEQYALSTMLAEMKAEDLHKEAKAEAKAARETLAKIMERGPEQLPLFDDAEKQPPVAEAATDEQPVEVDDESWKEVEVGELDIPDGIVTKLLEAEIATVGDLAIWSTEKSLTDIDGIGQAKADKIDAALEKFWAARKAGG